MSWAKFDDGLDEHEKVEALLDRRPQVAGLDEADIQELVGLAAVGLWTLTLTGSSRRLKDGAVSDRALRSLAPRTHAMLAGALLEVGMYDPADAGVLIHDFLDYNPSADEVLERRKAEAERKAEARAKAAARRPSEKTSGQRPAGQPVGRPEDVRADVQPDGAWVSDYPLPHPVPDPTRPGPSPSPDARERANGRGEGSLALAEHITGMLQRGIDGLTTEERCKAPTVPVILAALNEVPVTDTIAMEAASDARATAQSQNRAPNIAGLFRQKLAAAAGVTP